MYTSVNICQRFTRLITASEDDEQIPAIKEEISYLFSNRTSTDTRYVPKGPKFMTLKNRRFCVRNFDELSKVFYGIAMKMHRQAEDVLLADNSMPAQSEMTETHEYITQLLSTHREISLNRSPQEISTFSEDVFLKVYQNSFLKFSELPQAAIQKLTAGLLSKQSENTVKSYFHLMLDVLWLLLTLHQKNLENPEGETLEHKIETILREIHFIMFRFYERNNKFHVICPCIKVIYLRIQIFTERSGLSYWGLFNRSMTSYPEEFSLYMLKLHAQLQEYTEEGCLSKDESDESDRKSDNLEFLNEKWSLLMKDSDNLGETKIGMVLSHIEDLLTSLWLRQSKLEFFYVTWDYYSKKIEDIIEKHSFQEICLNKADKPLNGYLIFLRMLKNHLQTHPHHWNKFKGRIYTKFSSVRFAKLSEQGLHNLALLFFTLGDINGNFPEVSGKFLSLLKDLPEKKQNSAGVWNIYMFMIRQHLDKNVQVVPVYQIFNPLLESAGRNRNNFHLLTSFVHYFEQFYRVPDLTLKQSHFIGSWLEGYIKSCAHNDLVSLLHILSRVINHIVGNGVWYEYQPLFVGNVLTSLKRLGVNSSLVGTVAGLIVANSEGLDDFVEYYVSENIPAEVMWAFFVTLSRKSTFTTNERREFLTLKAWFLCEFIRDEGGCNKLGCDDFHPDLLKTIEGRKGRHSTLVNSTNRFEVFLQLVDRETLLGCLKDSEKFLARNLNIRVYTNMALVFHYCGQFIYIRTAATCYLSKFIDTFLLPMELLRGSKPSSLPLVEKTWHLFMFSLWELSLQDNDPYLERLLKDLTLRYLPLFNIRSGIVLKITGNYNLSEFVFRKIATEFFEQNKSKQHLFSDEVVFKLLSVVNMALDDLLSDASKSEMLVMFVRVFLLSLFEVYMFKNHKVLAMDMLKKMAALRGNRPEVRGLFREGLTAAMVKHMAFGTNQFFQMCYVLVKVVGDVVKELLGRIREEISLLECKRGQGFDNHLRQSYDRLVKMF